MDTNCARRSSPSALAALRSGVRLLFLTRLVQHVDRRLSQLQLSRLDEIVQLLQTRSTRDRRRDTRTRCQPRQRDLRRSRLILRRHLVQRLDYPKAAFIQILLDRAATLTLRQISFRTILARQKSCRQRVEVDHAQTFVDAERLQLGFVSGAVVKVVKRLQTLITRDAETLAHVQSFRESRSADWDAPMARTFPALIN